MKHVRVLSTGRPLGLQAKVILCLVVVVLASSLLAFAKDITSTRSIKEFFTEETGLRIGADAIQSYKTSLNEMSLKVIQRAAQLAKEDDRKTVLERDIEKASEEVFRRAPMTIEELMEKIKQLSIIDLAELSNQVKAYGQELLEKRKK